MNFIYSHLHFLKLDFQDVKDYIKKTQSKHSV